MKGRNGDFGTGLTPIGESEHLGKKEEAAEEKEEKKVDEEEAEEGERKRMSRRRRRKEGEDEEADRDNLCFLGGCTGTGPRVPSQW